MSWFGKVREMDPEVASLLEKELERQRFVLGLIASENFTSRAVMEVSGSHLTNKYSEGYPGRRYYGGNEYIDKFEELAISRAKSLFEVPYVNVQPYSGTPANAEVLYAVCDTSDVIIGQSLPDGGHLSHGHPNTFSGKYFNSKQYHVNSEGEIDFDEVERLAEENNPKLFWVGSSAYVYEFPFERFSKIAEKYDAYLVADISHISGLVVSGVHKSPVQYVHVVTTTTHKTLRGPRGAMIMITDKGLEKDPDLPKKIDSAVFPGMQGGPHDNTTAAMAVAFGEALKPDFKLYGQQIVKNSKSLAKGLIDEGLKLVGNGTFNHMVLVDLSKYGNGYGKLAEIALDTAGITTNSNEIPKEPSSSFYPTGLRLGTPGVTTRGMKESEMMQVAKMIYTVIENIKNYQLPAERTERKAYKEKFTEDVKENDTVKQIREEVIKLCKRFPLYEE